MKSLEIILTLLDYFFRQWHEQQKQKERDLVDARPADWFSQHFGVRSESNQGTSDKTAP